LLVDDDAGRAAAVSAGLTADGCRVVGIVADTADLVRAVRDTAAEVIVCDFDAPSRDCLESMRALNRDEPRPVVMFVDRSEPEAIVAAMEAGVAAYVIEGLSPGRVRSVIDVAVARFVAFQAMKAELEHARAALSDRKLIDRAKNVLMTTRGLSETDAHRRLRKLAMDRGQKLRDVAEQLVAAHDAPHSEQKSPNE
jgi:response regulator NasT